MYCETIIPISFFQQSSCFVKRSCVSTSPLTAPPFSDFLQLQFTAVSRWRYCALATSSAAAVGPPAGCRGNRHKLSAQLLCRHSSGTRKRAQMTPLESGAITDGPASICRLRHRREHIPGSQRRAAGHGDETDASAAGHGGKIDASTQFR